MVAGSLFLAGRAWPWTVSVVLIAVAFVRRPAVLSLISAVSVFLVVVDLGGAPTSAGKITILWFAVFSVGAIAALVLRCTTEVGPSRRPRLRRTGAALLLLGAGGCAIAAALFATITVHPSADSAVLPPTASCGSAFLPAHIRGAVPDASSVLDLSGCSDGRKNRQSNALGFLGLALLGGAISFGLSRRSEPGGTPAAPRRRRRIAVIAGTVTAATVMVGTASAFATPRTVDLTSRGDAAAVATGTCQALLGWSGSITSSVDATKTELQSDQPLLVRRQGVVALVAGLRTSTATLVDKLHAIAAGERDPGYREFVDTLATPFSEMIPRIDALIHQAQAMPTDSEGDFKAGKAAIRAGVIGLGASMTIGPAMLRSVPLPQALSLAGAFSTSPTCAPIFGGPSLI